MEISQKLLKKLAKELRDYIHLNKNQDECSGFADGFEKACEVLKTLENVEDMKNFETHNID